MLNESESCPFSPDALYQANVTLLKNGAVIEYRHENYACISGVPTECDPRNSTNQSVFESPEMSAGACSDNIDNDCDGVNDTDDPSCMTCIGIFDEPGCCGNCTSAGFWWNGTGICSGSSEFGWENAPGLTPQCCGDDPLENRRTSQYNNESIGNGSNEILPNITTACCDDSTDCVSGGSCYTRAYYANISGNITVVMDPIDVDNDGDSDICYNVSGPGTQWMDCLDDSDCDSGNGWWCELVTHDCTDLNLTNENLSGTGCANFKDDDYLGGDLGIFGFSPVDMDDPDCCQECLLSGGYFDTTSGTTCTAAGATTSALQIKGWEDAGAGGVQDRWCCGENQSEGPYAGKEFYRYSSDGGWWASACCTDPGMCVDGYNTCRYSVAENSSGGCTDGIDSDCDGAVDYCDTDCGAANNTHVGEMPPGEDCNDGLDNDCDGKIDDADEDCCQGCVDSGYYWDSIPGGCSGENITDFEWEYPPPQQNQSCCGDDAGEAHRFFDAFADIGAGCGDDITDAECVGRNDTPTDDACCDSPTDCVLSGVCYQNVSGSADVDGDGVIGETCSAAGKWRDCDANASLCTAPRCGSRNWTSGGENASFGEYANGSGIECCGDDAGEYFAVTGLNTSCCNTATDCVDNWGKCQVNDTWSPGGCTDGIDSDCDGDIDFNDTDCRALINGTLTSENGTLITGVNVTITAYATDPWTGVYVEFSTVTTTGAYNLYVIVNLTYNIVARLQTGGIAYNWSVLVDEDNNRWRTVDLTVKAAAGCDTDCTLPGENICRPECEGAAGCAYFSPISMQKCDGSQAGWFVPYNETFDVQCCEGIPSLRTQARIVGVRGPRDVVRVTRIISYGGQLISLIIDVFK